MSDQLVEMETLGLAYKYEGRVQLCFEAVENLIPGSEIYLYGSYAENQISPNSLLKILVLVGNNCSQREMKTLGWEVEEFVDKVSNEAFPFEITVLSTEIYHKCCTENAIMKALNKNKKNLHKVCWIDK